MKTRGGPPILSLKSYGRSKWIFYTIIKAHQREWAVYVEERGVKKGMKGEAEDPLSQNSFRWGKRKEPT